MKKAILTAISTMLTVILFAVCVSAATPVIYLPFDNSTSEIVGGTAEADSDVTLADGIAGKCASLDYGTVTVTTEYTDLPKSTFMAWVKMAEPAIDYASVFSGPWEGTNVHFNVLANGTIEIGVSACAWAGGRVSAATVDDGDWHHIAITFDTEAGEMNFYIDGELDNECFPTADAGLNFSSFEVGSWNAGRYFIGSIDELAIFDTILSADEIKALATPGTPASGTAAAPAEAETEAETVTVQTEAAVEEPVETAPVTTAPKTFDAVIITVVAAVMASGVALISKKR